MGSLLLTELAPGVEVEEVKQKTGAKFEVAENLRQVSTLLHNTEMKHLLTLYPFCLDG